MADFLFVYSEHQLPGVFRAHTVLPSQEVWTAECSNVYISGEWYPADCLNWGLSSDSHCENRCWDSFQIEMFPTWYRHFISQNVHFNLAMIMSKIWSLHYIAATTCYFIKVGLICFIFFARFKYIIKGKTNQILGMSWYFVRALTG